MRPGLSKKEEKVLYWIGIAILFVTMILVILVKMLDIHLSEFLPGCLLLRFTGFYCPGCGGTRAVIALFQGQFVKSFFYHPLVIYVAAVGGWYLISHTIELISKGKYSIGMRYRDIYLYLAAALILINWIVKNLLIFLLGLRLL
ncbi:MAG: DUF2752 domain-containing protein [Lachnospiraceae bacterium]|nr:DUF2752 domain-containing protein [Lachnospiraceae bacterium]